MNKILWWRHLLPGLRTRTPARLTHPKPASLKTPRLKTKTWKNARTSQRKRQTRPLQHSWKKSKRGTKVKPDSDSKRISLAISQRQERSSNTCKWNLITRKVNLHTQKKSSSTNKLSSILHTIKFNKRICRSTWWVVRSTRKMRLSDYRRKFFSVLSIRIPPSRKPLEKYSINNELNSVNCLSFQYFISFQFNVN